MNNTTPDPPLTFYPAYCFARSPTYHTWARLTAADVHALTTRPGFEGQNLYFHLNHPIKWIRLVGAIVALDSYERRLVLTLDDSSGATIEITVAKQPSSSSGPSTGQNTTTARNNETLHTGNAHPGPTMAISPTGKPLCLDGVDVGTVVKVKGGIGEFRGTKQLCLERIAVVESTDAEVRAWEEGVRFRCEVLAGPWVVDEGVRRGLEVEAVEGKVVRKGEKRRKRERERGREKGEKGEGGQERRGREGNDKERSGREEGETKDRRHRHRHGHRHKRRESDKENVNGEG